LASKKRKSRALLSSLTDGQAGPEAAQQLTAEPAHKKKSKGKKKSETTAAPAVAPDPALAPKNKKQTVKVVGAHAVQQPAGESAAEAEEDWSQDPGAEEEGNMQWVGKQKRKRNRVAASAPRLPLPADKAAENASPVRNQVLAAVCDALGYQQRLPGQPAEAPIRYTVPPLTQFSQAQAVAIDLDLQQITGHDNLTRYSPAQREIIGSVLKKMHPGTKVCLPPPQVKQSLLTSFYGGCSSKSTTVGLDNAAAVAVAAATAEAGGGSHAPAATAEAGGGPPVAAATAEDGGGSYAAVATAEADGGSPAASNSTNTTTTPQSSGHHAEGDAEGDAEDSYDVEFLFDKDNIEGPARRATPSVDSVLRASSQQGTPSSSDVSSTALNTAQKSPIAPQIMAKFAAAAAAVATAKAASASAVPTATTAATAATAAADAHNPDYLPKRPIAGLLGSNPDKWRSDKLAEDKVLLQKASTSEEGAEGLAGSGSGAQIAEDADETVLEEDSEQAGITEGVPMCDCVCCALKICSNNICFQQRI